MFWCEPLCNTADASPAFQQLLLEDLCVRRDQGILAPTLHLIAMHIPQQALA
jgi:hypothetical protein